MAYLKLQPGWDKVYAELVELFKYDKNVHVIYDHDNMEVNLFVAEDADKAEALSILIPKEYNFGNVTLHVNVIPPNKEPTMDLFNVSAGLLFSLAFSNNPVFSFTKTVEGVFTNPIVYVVFARLIAQFFNDNLNDVYGNCTMLYADMAKDVFRPNDEKNIFFCTDKDEIYVLDDKEDSEEPFFLDECWP